MRAVENKSVKLPHHERVVRMLSQTHRFEQLKEEDRMERGLVQCTTHQNSKIRRSILTTMSKACIIRR